MEARIIRTLSSRGVFLFNTQVSAREASRRLGQHAEQIADLGDDLARALARRVFAGRTNPLTTPAHMLRETSIRVVLSADRALSAEEVLQRLVDIGAAPSGLTPLHTIRRDLTIRESDTAGPVRVASGHRYGHAIFWPASMSARTAVRRYDEAHSRCVEAA